jgi:DNA-binding transcriptional ArsR family regulator
VQQAGSITAPDERLSKLLGALADPVRRAILERLSQAPSPVNELVSGFAITRPAVSRHLRVLREAGLVGHQAVGRQRLYALRPDALMTLDDWLDVIRTPAAEQWGRRLDALATEVHRTRRERRAGSRQAHHGDEEGAAS